MPEAEEPAKIKEPLAKFHTNMTTKGQIVIPKRDRELFGLGKDDIVEVIVRKVITTENSRLLITGAAYVVTKLSSRGLITIPDEVREQLNITQESTLEVLLVGFHKFEELISPKGKSLLSKLSHKPFKIIKDAQEESELIEKSMTYYSYSISKN